MAITITVAVEKGGVGKTTTVTNLAILMARDGKRVLAVDMDGQANTTFFLTGNKKRDDAYRNKGVAEMLRAHSLVEPGHFISHSKYENLDIIPSNAATNTIPEILETLVRSYGDSKNRYLAYCLAEVEENYDYIIIDTPPNLDIYTRCALAACDYLLIPFNSEEQVLDGLQDTDEQRRRIMEAEDADIRLLGIVGTMVDRTGYTNYMHEQLRQSVYAPYLFENTVRRGVAVREGSSVAEAVVEYAPTSNPAKDYVAVYEELKERIRRDMERNDS